MFQKFVLISFALAFYGNCFANGLGLTHKVGLNVNLQTKEIVLNTKNEILKEIRRDLKNKHKQTFHQIINSDDIKSISYMLASDQGYGRSSFGHAYLRLSRDYELSENDITIEFVADVENDDLEYLKAVGFGENYKIKVVKSSYKDVKRQHTIKEDRDLTSFVLDLKSLQKEKIIQKINLMLLSGVDKGYSFFSNNCADIVTDVLNTGFTKPVTGIKSVIPNQIPNILDELGIVKDRFNDLGKSKQRKALIERSFPKNLDENARLEYMELKGLLSDQSLSKRVHGYYRLHLIRDKMNLMNGIKLTAFVANLLKFESQGIKANLIKLFSTRETKIKEFDRVRFQFASRGNLYVHRNYFTTRGNKVFLNTVVREVGRRKKYRFEMPNLFFKDNKIFDKDGLIISYKLSKHLSKDGFFSPSTLLMTRIIKSGGKNFLSSMLLTEKKDFRNKSKKNFNDLDEIAYRNGDFQNTDLGLCFAHSELSKKLETNTIFLPNESPLSIEKGLELVKELYNNQIVVIPGFESAKDFTSSLPINELGKVISKRQATRYSFNKRFFDYFSEIHINNENIYNLKNLIDIGINPIIVFKYKGNLGHSVLVSRIIDKGDHYEFDIIDPNMSYQEGIYKMDKKTSKLSTVFYGDVDILLPKIDLFQEIGVANVLKMKKLRDIAIKSAKSSGTYYMSPSEFYR